MSHTAQFVYTCMRTGSGGSGGSGSGSAVVSFVVSNSVMTYEDAKSHCSRSSSSLAAIYNAKELSLAKEAIAAAGVTKAITAAECTLRGWTWGATDNWQISDFPLNTGEILDHKNCQDGKHMYLLDKHGSWDAVMKNEKHHVLCRRSGKFVCCASM